MAKSCKNNNNKKVVKVVQWKGTLESWNKIIKMGLRDWEPGEMGTRTFFIAGKLVKEGDWVVKREDGTFYSCKSESDIEGL